MSLLNKQKKILSLVNKAKEQKKFSHAYLACGSLLKQKKVFEHLVSDDQRSLFDLASLTKALVTTPLLFREQEKDPEFFDRSFKEALRGNVSLFPKKIQGLKLIDLLSHRSGLPAWRSLWINCGLKSRSSFYIENSQEEFLKRLNFISLKHTSSFCYSDLGFILLGLCIECRQEKSLDQVFQEFCCENLSLNTKLCFAPSSATRNRVVPTSYCQLRKKDLCGEVHDENSAFLGGVTGHAGLFGAGEDVVKFLEALALTPLGKKILEKNFVSFEKQKQRLASTYGWQQAPQVFSPVKNTRAIGHLGFTGCSFWLAKKGLHYGVFLTNRVRSGRRIEPWLRELRCQVYTFFQEILDDS